MNLTREKARDRKPDIKENLKNTFGSRAEKLTDAIISDDHMLGVCGLSFYAPICMMLENDELISQYLLGFAGKDNLFVFDGDVIAHFTPDGEAFLPDEVSERLAEIRSLAENARGILGEEGEHIIDLKAPKIGCHYDINLLIGNRTDFSDPMMTTPKSALDSLGRGSFRAGAARQVLASRYTLNPEENGDPANRQFYIFENGKQIFYSANVRENVKTAVCRHMRNRSVIEYETECGLKITRTIFILPQENGMPEAVEAQIINIENLSKEERTLKVVASGCFGLCSPESTMNDIIYASITWEGGIIKDGDTPVFVCPSPNPKYLAPQKRFATLISGGECFDEYCTSYSEFIGAGSLKHPLGAAKLSSVQARKIVPFFAMGKTITVGSGKGAELLSLVGMMTVCGGDDKPFISSLEKLLEKYRQSGEAEKALASQNAFFEAFCSYIKLSSGDSFFDTYAGENLPFQVCYQSFVSRSFAWTQKAFREIGFREIQDLEAALYYFVAMGKSKLVREMLTAWIRNVYEMGYANHNFYETGKEPGICSDDQLWLSQAVYRYVTLTGDTGYLLEEVETADGTSRRTVFDTLLKTVEYSGKISVGKHGLPLMDRGDWNDCLRLDLDFIDGPEKERRYKAQLKEKRQNYGAPFENDLSESVMNAFLLKIAYDEITELANMLGKTDVALSLEKDAAALSEKVQLHCWKNGFFVRAMIGGGRGSGYLGSAGDGLSSDENIDGTYYLNSFSWSILSGIATEEQIKSMLEKVNKYLRTSAGLKLCTPAALEKLKAGNSAVNYFPGDRENGGVFKHANMMASAAMLKAAKTVKDKELAASLAFLAFETINFILPYKTMENPFVLCGNPRFCTQYNNSETHENIGPMLSGTASWLALTLFEMLGIEYTEKGISLSPVIFPEKTEMSYTVKTQHTTLEITVKKPLGFARVNDDTVCTLDGNPSALTLPRDITGEHKITISI